MVDAWNALRTTSKETEEELSGNYQRQLSLDVPRVELRLYRRTRTSADAIPQQPHFVYLVRCQWTGLPMPSTAPTIYPGALLYEHPLDHANMVPSSPRSPRWEYRVRASEVARKAEPGTTGYREFVRHASRSKRSCSQFGPAPSAERSVDLSWADQLPSSYVVRRRWNEVVRFHKALIGELAFDRERECRRVKSRIPELPSPGDLEAFLQAAAATGDACTLQRRQPLATVNRPPERSLEDLDDLHWIYVEKRLQPYFVEVNRILHELPNEVLLSNRTLRHFVTAGGVTGQSLTRTGKAKPVPTRFLGPLVPMQPEEADIAEAARELNRNRSAPSLVKAGGASSTESGKNQGSSSLPRLRP